MRRDRLHACWKFGPCRSEVVQYLDRLFLLRELGAAHLRLWPRGREDVPVAPPPLRHASLGGTGGAARGGAGPGGRHILARGDNLGDVDPEAATQGPQLWPGARLGRLGRVDARAGSAAGSPPPVAKGPAGVPKLLPCREAARRGGPAVLKENSATSAFEVAPDARVILWLTPPAGR